MAEQNASINGSTGVTNHSGLTPEERERGESSRRLAFAQSLFVWILSVVEIPIMILTLFALCVLIKSHRSAPVFVIHLILSDLIQIICMVIWTFSRPLELTSAYWYSFIAGLYFMACVAVERYLLVSHPVWYKAHNSLKVSCVISVIIWFVPLIFARINSDWLYFSGLYLFFACFTPYPIILLCFVGTCRGLSHAISLSPLKRRLILGSLFLVLLTYTFLILPTVIISFIIQVFEFNTPLLLKCFHFSLNLLYVNPLADCILYLFMRPDVGGLMKCVHCGCRTDTHQNSTHSQDKHSHSRSACTSV